MAHMPGPGEPTFGHTDSVFPDPEAVSGAPHEPAPMRAISRIEMLLASVAFCGILVGVLYQVLGRYVPSVSWIGAGELALLSMVSLNFLMIGYLTGRNGHITIEIFDTMLAGKKSFVALRVFSALIMLVTCIWMAVDAWAKIGAEMSRGIRTGSLRDSPHRGRSSARSCDHGHRGCPALRLSTPFGRHRC